MGIFLSLVPSFTNAHPQRESERERGTETERERFRAGTGSF